MLLLVGSTCRKFSVIPRGRSKRLTTFYPSASVWPTSSCMRSQGTSTQQAPSTRGGRYRATRLVGGLVSLLTCVLLIDSSVLWGPGCLQTIFNSALLGTTPSRR